MKKKDPTLADAAQAAGLRDRTVRQEPPRRPRRAFCRRCTASTSSSATCTTSMPRTSRSTPTIRRTPSSSCGSVRAACMQATIADRRGSGSAMEQIEDTGPLDQEAHGDQWTRSFSAPALDFIDRAKPANKPFFAWFNSTRMHIWTHLKPRVAGQDRAGRLSRRHGRARRSGRAAAEEARRTRHRRQHHRDLLRPTTVPRHSPGPTAARRRSAARRTPTGKAATACRA